MPVPLLPVTAPGDVQVGIIRLMGMGARSSEKRTQEKDRNYDERCLQYAIHFIRLLWKIPGAATDTIKERTGGYIATC